ncbi:RHS repeat domain-containing protein [Pseudomonas sp. DCB_BI]|uniref:RHS repeat domain-containing protein n=1 Tax=Pseudomonas sp. DCB_BI TaxID=2993594 RepID=UPI003A4DF705
MQSEARYRYDCLGRRIGKEVTRNGQTERITFLWQGLRLLQEQQPQLRSLYNYEPDSYAPLASIDSDPEQPERPGKCYWFHTDQIGTPQELTDAEGQVVWRAYYKAWGGLEALSPNGVEQNLRFQGQYHDRETGCTTIRFGITIRGWGGLRRRIRLGWWGGSIYTSMRQTLWVGSIRLD